MNSSWTDKVQLNKCVAKWHTDGCTGCKECRAALLKLGVSLTVRVCGCLEREHYRNEPVSAACHWGLPREIPYLQRETGFCPFHSPPPLLSLRASSKLGRKHLPSVTSFHPLTSQTGWGVKRRWGRQHKCAAEDGWGGECNIFNLKRLRTAEV